MAEVTHVSQAQRGQTAPASQSSETSAFPTYIRPQHLSTSCISVRWKPVVDKPEVHMHSTGPLVQSPYATATKLTRRSPLDKTRLLADPAVQDLMAESGARRTLFTNIKDNGPHINTNLLRFTREFTFTGNLHKDGGTSYAPTICSGNWVEERQEDKYASGFHARELGFTKIYATEHSSSFAPPTEKVKRFLSSVLLSAICAP